MKSKEYLNEIRKTDALKRAVLASVAVSGRTVTFRLVTDLTYSQEDIDYAQGVSSRFVPTGYTARVTLFKSVPDGAAVSHTVREFLLRKYPAVASLIAEEDVRAEAGLGGGHFVISLGDTERTRFENLSILDDVVRELTRTVCGTWTGEFEYREKPPVEWKDETPPEEYAMTPRFFPVTDYAPIDGAAPKSAIYIADLNGEMTGVSVCGGVNYIEEKETKNGKPYFSVTLSDGSGQLRAAYFSKKATIEKVRSVKQGDRVCLTGDNEIFNGSLSFRVKAIDFGAPPKDFVPQPRPSRPVPVRYKKVFPVPEDDYVQSDLFSEDALPADLVANDIVVFDLETTGLNNSASGSADRIIEIGAVKIHAGKISERFSSFIACPVRLSEEIKGLTGIDDDMLVGAPDIADVMADFYKFCDGCSLVGHNVQFDIKFVRLYAGEQGFQFGHRLFDTLTLSQRLLRLSNYKLNTVADHFGFRFHHHRAFDDAFVTAKVFIELVKINKELPRD